MEKLKIDEVDDLDSVAAYYYDGHKDIFKVYKIRERIDPYTRKKYIRFFATMIISEKPNEINHIYDRVMCLKREEGDVYNGYFWLRDRDDEKARQTIDNWKRSRELEKELKKQEKIKEAIKLLSKHCENGCDQCFLNGTNDCPKIIF